MNWLRPRRRLDAKVDKRLFAKLRSHDERQGGLLACSCAACFPGAHLQAPNFAHILSKSSPQHSVRDNVPLLASHVWFSGIVCSEGQGTPSTFAPGTPLTLVSICRLLLLRMRQLLLHQHSARYIPLSSITCLLARTFLDYGMLEQILTSKASLTAWWPELCLPLYRRL